MKVENLERIIELAEELDDVEFKLSRIKKEHGEKERFVDLITIHTSIEGRRGEILNDDAELMAYIQERITADLEKRREEIIKEIEKL